MKKLITPLLFLLCLYANAQSFTLKVEITGFNSNKGKAFVALYNSEKTFLSKPLKGKIEEIKNNKAVVVFEDLSPGVYAISSFHDENNNGKLDKNFLGIPKEDYAISNNAKGFMSAPKYHDANFSLQENKSISIKIQ
jgi:uncharacterized protein (DUF2141 family)